MAATTTDTRERILRTTLHLIGENGIGGVSNRAIAAHARVSLGSLTYHFPSQTQLLREALLLYVGEEVARVEAVAAELRATRPPLHEIGREVERIVERSAARHIEQVAEVELHLHASRDPHLHEASARCFAAYEDLAAAILEALEVPDPVRHARTVVALLYGLGLRRLGTGQAEAAGTADALLTIVRGAARRAKSRD